MLSAVQRLDEAGLVEQTNQVAETERSRMNRIWPFCGRCTGKLKSLIWFLPLRCRHKVYHGAMEAIHVDVLTEAAIADVAPLVVAFRQGLRAHSTWAAVPDADAAEAELRDYLAWQYPVYVVWVEEAAVGYAVAKVEDDTVWLEAIYVMPAWRRVGLGSRLFETVESLAVVCGDTTVYANVQPRNLDMFVFLKAHDYNVVNTLEIRKAGKEESLNDFELGTGLLSM